jgi:hypothetical protein
MSNVKCQVSNDYNVKQHEYNVMVILTTFANKKNCSLLMLAKTNCLKSAIAWNKFTWHLTFAYCSRCYIFYVLPAHATTAKIKIMPCNIWIMLLNSIIMPLHIKILRLNSIIMPHNIIIMPLNILIMLFNIIFIPLHIKLCRLTV